MAGNATLGLTITSGYKVAAIGDSITYGAGLPSPATQAWPAIVQNLLGAQFNVQNYGVSGTTALVDGTAPYVNTGQYTTSLAFGPQVVAIELGTNDTSLNNVPTKGTTDFVNSLTALVNAYQALASHPQVWLCLPPPIWTAYPSDNETWLDTLMPFIQSVATATGAKVIDNHTALVNEQQLFPDNLHPYIPGEYWMGQNVYASLAATLFANSPVGTGLLTLSGGTLSDDGTARTLNNSVLVNGPVTFASTGSGSLIFDPTGVSPTPTFAFSGTPTLTVNNTTTIKETITGSGFTVAGTGNLILSGANTYSGSTTITGGAPDQQRRRAGQRPDHRQRIVDLQPHGRH